MMELFLLHWACVDGMIHIAHPVQNNILARVK